MKKFKSVFIAVGCLLVLTACGNLSGVGRKQTGSEAAEVQKNDAEYFGEISGNDFVELSVNNLADDTEAEPKPELYHFVDIYGERFEAEIDPDAERNDYISDSFVYDGNVMSYVDDERYDYRRGIDVSHYQGKIDWQQVKDAGNEFVFIRIGYRGYGKEGKICPDKEFESYIKGAQAVGMDVGVYFFSQAINEEEAEEEARFVLDRLAGRELQLPVVYDPESIVDAQARTDDVTGEQFTANTKVFCETIKDAGYEAMIYSNMVWEAYQFDLSELSDYEIWYADYTHTLQTPYHFVFWQYTNKGSVPGIAGNADLNIQLIEKND